MWTLTSQGSQGGGRKGRVHGAATTASQPWGGGGGGGGAARHVNTNPARRRQVAVLCVASWLMASWAGKNTGTRDLARGTQNLDTCLQHKAMKTKIRKHGHGLGTSEECRLDKYFSTDTKNPQLEHKIRTTNRFFLFSSQWTLKKILTQGTERDKRTKGRRRDKRRTTSQQPTKTVTKQNDKAQHDMM